MEERHILELDSGGSYMTRFSCQDSQNYMVEWVNFTLYIYKLYLDKSDFKKGYSIYR